MARGKQSERGVYPEKKETPSQVGRITSGGWSLRISEKKNDKQLALLMFLTAPRDNFSERNMGLKWKKEKGEEENNFNN